MKISSLLLALSFAGNAALLGLIVAGSQSAPDAPVRIATAPTAPAATKSASNDDLADGPAAWIELHSDDLAKQRDRLKAAGFPLEVIRAILGAEISDNFSARRKAIENAQGETPFWKNPLRDPKAQAALRELYKEQEKIMKDLLGRDARNDDPAYASYLKRQFGDLPDDKADQLRDIQNDYNQRRSEFYAGGAAMLPEDRQKIADLDKAMHAEFANVLTPQELEDYDLRASNTAQQLRYNLTAFDATEDEYKAIYKLQAAFDDQYRMTGPIPRDQMQARMEAQKQLTEDIKTALGADRGAEYVRDTDYSYRQTSQLVARLELPPETAASIWAVQQDVQAQQKTMFGPGMTAADRTQKIQALQQQAIDKITPLLGGDPSRVEVYKQNGGQWLQYMMPRPAIK